MEKAVATRFINLLKKATSPGSAPDEATNFFNGVRNLMAAANVTLDDVIVVAMNERLPEIQAQMLEEIEALRGTCAKQAEMMEVLRTEKALQAANFTQAAIAMNLLPQTAEAGAALLDAGEMAAMNQEVETRIARVRAMHAGDDFTLFEDFVIERLGYAAGWQTAFCEATGVPRWRIQNFRAHDYVPPEMFVLAGNFTPVERKAKIEWSDEMYAYLSDMVIMGEYADLADLAERLGERFGIEFPVSAVTAAKNRLKRWKAEEEEARAAEAARKRRRAPSKASTAAAAAEAERQRVIREEAKRCEAEAEAAARADEEWEEAATVSRAPTPKNDVNLWLQGIYA